jgi:antirestriction protein ArdC
MKGICFFFRATKPLEKGKGETTMTNTSNHETWAQLLHSAVHTPGKLLAAYTAFHNYSFGNALLALTQCRRRNLEPGPLNTYRGWMDLKRQVRKGERGITLCMPMQYKKRVRKDDAQDEGGEELTRSTFGFRAYWFVLAQTDGEAMDTLLIPGFNLETALRTLNISRTEFDEINGNIQGFATGREIAVSPVAAIPHKTTFHEIAHCVLEHTTKEKLVDSEDTTINLREVEAEAVALICCETLSLEGAEYARGYIQHWLNGEKEIPNHNAARIFTAASKILKAGNPVSGSQ